MSKPLLLQRTWDQGMVYDAPWENLPVGATHGLYDYIPGSLGPQDYPAPLVTRGGWAYASLALGGSTSISSITFAPFTSGLQLVATTADDGKLYTVTMPDDVDSLTVVGGSTQIGNWSTQWYTMNTFHRDLLLGWPLLGGETIKQYNGTATSDLAAAPKGSTGCVYKDRTWTAYDGTSKNRIWWSDAGDPTTWDTSDPGGWWVDADYPVEALASPGNAIIVFHKDRASRIRGAPGMDDFILEGLFDVGVVDKRSIVNWKDRVIWADMRGIYMSDGVSMTELTKDRINRLYRQVMKDSDATFIAAAIYHDYYLLNVYGGVQTPYTFVCDLTKNVWFVFRNIRFSSASSWPGGFTKPGSDGTLVDTERCYGAYGNRLIRLDDMWTNKTYVDGDGNDVIGRIDTPFYWIGKDPNPKRLQQLYVRYSGPTNNISCYTSPDIYERADLGTFYAGVANTRARVPIRRQAQGISFQIEQTSPGHQQVYELQIDAWLTEGSR